MIRYQCGYKYQLVEPARFEMPPPFDQFQHADRFLMIQDGILHIAAGYAWDGPSGPTLDSKDFMRGSLVHDALYQLMREGVIPRSHKDAADLLLVELCKADGMGSIRRWYVYQAVKRFGAPATIQNRDILVAP